MPTGNGQQVCICDLSMADESIASEQCRCDRRDIIGQEGVRTDLTQLA